MIPKIICIIAFLAVLEISLFAVEEIPFLQGEYDPSKWPVAHLKLSQAATLKNVFDSGLRPYRFPGLETSTLEVKHIRLITHLTSEKVLPEINAEWLNIKMFDDGEISQIEGATPQLSLQEARGEMSKWLPYGTRSKKDLDDYLKAVDADPLDFDDPYRGLPDGCGIGWKEPEWGKGGGGAHCGIGFRKTFNQAQPLRLYFSFSWSSNRPLKTSRGYIIPIPLPPGYEHVSMKAPEKFGPDSGVDINLSKGISIGQPAEDRRAYEKAKKDDSLGRPEKPRLTTSDDLTKANPNKSDPSSWWLIASSIGLFIMALVAWLKFQKSKSSD